MRTELSTLNNDLQRDLAVTLQIRIGVNTGEVIIGERRQAAPLPRAMPSTWPPGSSRPRAPVRC